MLKKRKKTLGILLVFCFLMSVTAAAVSAAPDRRHRQGDHHGEYEYGYDGVGVVEEPVVVQPAEVVATPAVVDYGYVDGGYYNGGYYHGHHHGHRHN